MVSLSLSLNASVQSNWVPKGTQLAKNGDLGKFNLAICPERQVTENVTSQALRDYFGLAVIRSKALNRRLNGHVSVN